MEILTLDLNVLMIYKKAIKLCQQRNYVISECKRNYFYFAEQNIVIRTKYLRSPIPCKNLRIYRINLPIEISDLKDYSCNINQLTFFKLSQLCYLYT